MPAIPSGVLGFAGPPGCMTYRPPVTTPRKQPSGPAEVGRPRHYDAETERSMLLRAGSRLLRTQKQESVTLAAILEESTLHTRAFYRHFRTKEDLFVAVHWQQGEELHSILQARVQAAPSPMDGVVAWIDQMLRLQFYRPAADHVSAYKEAVETMYSKGLYRPKPLLMEPLREALAAGQQDGSLPNAVPDLHAAMIWSLVWDAAKWAPRGNPQRRWAMAREQLVAFAMTGLGGIPQRRSGRAPGHSS